jgi:dihydroorotate dehydrogenase electron transfer subunit
LSNERIAERIYRMTLRGETEGIRPGQFVEIEIPGKYLRRPISVSNIEGDVMTIIYKVVGEGTAIMAQMHAGETLDILTGLGNGYDLTKAGDEVLLIGGGVGVPPLLYAAKELRRAGKKVRAVLGFNTAEEVFGEQKMQAMGCEVRVCTMDGSYGEKGVVTEQFTIYNSQCTMPFYYACGPLPMIKAILRTIGTNGQISMEERMGCGVGICMGCTIETHNGYKRVCKEGPVFNAEELTIES